MTSPALTNRVFLAATAAVALHVADDNFIQPPGGTTAADHLVSGLVPLALLGLAAWFHSRVRAGAAGVIALSVGLFGVVVGAIEAGYYTQAVGPSGDDYSGFLAAAAGLVLLGLGSHQLWRSRRSGGHWFRRHARRTLRVLGAVVVANFVALPIGFAYLTTHVAVARSRQRTWERRTRTSPSPRATASSSRVGTCRRRTAPRSSPSTAATCRRRTRGCSRGTATACCCWTVAAWVTATVTATCSAGAGRRTSMPPSTSSRPGPTSTRPGSAASASRSAAKRCCRRRPRTPTSPRWSPRVPGRGRREEQYEELDAAELLGQRSGRWSSRTSRSRCSPTSGRRRR